MFFEFCRSHPPFFYAKLQNKHQKALMETHLLMLLVCYTPMVLSKVKMLNNKHPIWLELCWMSTTLQLETLELIIWPLIWLCTVVPFYKNILINKAHSTLLWQPALTVCSDICITLIEQKHLYQSTHFLWLFNSIQSHRGLVSIFKSHFIRSRIHSSHT